LNWGVDGLEIEVYGWLLWWFWGKRWIELVGDAGGLYWYGFSFIVENSSISRGYHLIVMFRGF